ARPGSSGWKARSTSSRTATSFTSDSTYDPVRRLKFSRNFGLYLASRFCSATAMMMMRAAIAWHVFALSHSAFHLGLIGLVQFVPVLSLMMVGGALADTYDRRRIMMCAQLLPLGSSVALVLATRSGHVGLPLLYAVVALGAVAWAFDSPSRTALLPT